MSIHNRFTPDGSQIRIALLEILFGIAQRVIQQRRHMNTDADMATFAFVNPVTQQPESVYALTTLPESQQVRRFSFTCELVDGQVQYTATYHDTPSEKVELKGELLSAFPLKRIEPAYH